MHQASGCTAYIKFNSINTATMWKLDDLISIEVSPIKQRAPRASATGWEAVRQRKETYASITIWDKRYDINARPKVVNINNPFPAFLEKIQKDPSLWEVKRTPIWIQIEEDGGSVSERVIHLTQVFLTYYMGQVMEMTHSLERQMANLRRSNQDIIAWSDNEGETWYDVS